MFRVLVLNVHSNTFDWHTKLNKSPTIVKYDVSMKISKTKQSVSNYIGDYINFGLLLPPTLVKVDTSNPFELVTIVLNYSRPFWFCAIITELLLEFALRTLAFIGRYRKIEVFYENNKTQIS